MGTPAEFQIARARNVDCNPGNITAPASLSRAISAVNLASSYRFTRRLRGPTGDSLRRAALAPLSECVRSASMPPVLLLLRVSLGRTPPVGVPAASVSAEHELT